MPPGLVSRTRIEVGPEYRIVVHAVEKNEVERLVPVLEIARTGTLKRLDVVALARVILEVLERPFSLLTALRGAEIRGGPSLLPILAGGI